MVIVIPQEYEMDTFGHFVKQRRLDLGIGLREFCQSIRVDPSNFSKIERGKLEPPQPGSPQFNAICEVLNIQAGSSDAKEVERLASLQRGMIPPAILANEQIAAKLPAFFRSMDGSPISEEERADLIRIISEA